MTYNEFKEVVKNVDGYELSESNFFIAVEYWNKGKANKFSVYKLNQYEKSTEINFFEPDDLKVLKAVNELANTPLCERESDKKYYLKHKFMTSTFDNGSNYLNCNSEIYFLGTKKPDRNYKTIFTKKEIEDIEQKLNSNLTDFEMIEVEQ